MHYDLYIMKSLMLSPLVRHRVPTVFFLVLLLSLANPVQAATPKAGAKCSKAGTTATASGKKFTCIKSGNKLVWNKGVAVKAARKPSPNPVFKPVEPTPTATPTPSPTATPTPTPSVKPVEFNATAKKAFDIIQAAKIQSSNLTYTYRIGNFAAPDVAKVVQRYVENAAQIYSLFLESPRVVTIHVFTEKDMPALSDSTFFTNQTGLKFFTDWWSKDESQINASYGALGTFYNSECSVSTNQCTGPAGHAGAAYPSRATALTLDQHSLSVPSHELFHVMQDFYRFNGKPQYLVTEEVKDFSMRPVFREGGATFMALSSSLTDFAQYEDGMNFYKNWAAKEFAADIKGLNSPEDVVSLLVKLERLDRSARLYGLGTYLHEWLIANYGLEKFISLTKKHNVGKEFNDLFTETYGMSLKDAYTKAAPHILERVKG
jgi:hypothetical protein